MKRGILLFLALSAALSIAWPNGAQESQTKKERVAKAPKKSAPLVFSYLKDKPIYSVKIPPPELSAPPPAPPPTVLAPGEPVARVKQTDFKESNPSFASYGCATMAVLGTVQTMTNTQFTKPEVEKIIAKNKENGGFSNTNYKVIWEDTFNTALEESGSKSTCVGVIKLDTGGNEVYNYSPKDMSGVYMPSTGPVKGVVSGHYVEATLPTGARTVYNPGNTDISLEEKEIIIPLIKVYVQPAGSVAEE